MSNLISQSVTALRQHHLPFRFNSRHNAKWKRRNRALIATAELSKREHLPAQPFYVPFSEAVEDSPAPDNAKQFAALVEFLRQYLVCDEHQFSVLALWIVHTWCFELFSTAAYLNVRSPEPQSGKTLCLDLLELLCRSPWLAPGADSRTVEIGRAHV